MGKIEKHKYEVIENNVESNETIKFKNSTVVLGNVDTLGNIICYKDLIVIGEINAEYILVVGDLICLGDINVGEIDIEGDMRCISPPDSDIINIYGNIIYLDNYKNNCNKNKMEIDNIIISKDDFICDITENKYKYSIQEIYNKLKPIQHMHTEFSYCEEFLRKIMNLEKECNSIKEYTYILNLIKKVPKYILDVNTINNKINYIKDIDLRTLNIEIDKSDIPRLYSYIYKTNEIIGTKYNSIEKILNDFIIKSNNSVECKLK